MGDNFHLLVHLNSICILIALHFHSGSGHLSQWLSQSAHYKFTIIAPIYSFSDFRQSSQYKFTALPKTLSYISSHHTNDNDPQFSLLVVFHVKHLHTNLNINKTHAMVNIETLKELAKERNEMFGLSHVRKDTNACLALSLSFSNGVYFLFLFYYFFWMVGWRGARQKYKCTETIKFIQEALKRKKKK